MNPYELKIVESLIPEYGSEEEALKIIIEYIEPIRELGAYYGPEDIADSVMKIVKKGISAKQWLAHMRKLDAYDPMRSTNQIPKITTDNINDEKRLANLESELTDLKTEMNKMTLEISHLAGVVKTVFETQVGNTGNSDQSAKQLGLL